MRVHVDTVPRAWEMEVYLDGEKADLCIEADDAEGWIRCLVRGANGKVAHNEDHSGWLEVTRHGHVELRRVGSHSALFDAAMIDPDYARCE